MKKTKRALPNAALVASTAQAFAHQNSVVVNRQRQLLEFERSQTDEGISQLRASLSRQIKKRGELDAKITGLTLVIERRTSTFGSQG